MAWGAEEHRENIKCTWDMLVQDVGGRKGQPARELRDEQQSKYL